MGSALHQIEQATVYRIIFKRDDSLRTRSLRYIQCGCRSAKTLDFSNRGKGLQLPVETRIAELRPVLPRSAVAAPVGGGHSRNAIECRKRIVAARSDDPLTAKACA